MTYFGFLLRFIGIPIVALAVLHLLDRHRGRRLPDVLRSWPPWAIAALHVLIAVTYTTPWDNYLVATEVWWYDTNLVCGITLGWVPIEEYTFFVVQTVMTSLLLLFLARRITVRDRPDYSNRTARIAATGLLAVIWMASVAVLIADWTPGVYMALILAWALLPVMIQTAFGADILWRYRELVFTTIASATVYLGIADGLAIHSGTWTISEEKTLGLLLGGVLPIEEFTFFLMTNVLVVFGTTLALAAESQPRLMGFLPARISDVLRPHGRTHETASQP